MICTHIIQQFRVTNKTGLLLLVFRETLLTALAGRRRGGRCPAFTKFAASLLKLNTQVAVEIEISVCIDKIENI